MPNENKTTVRERCLDEAKKIVCGDRDKSYGGPENSFQVIADLWSTYLGFKGLTPRDVGIMMALMKIARISTSGGKSWDSYIDLAGYAACAMECESSKNTPEKTSTVSAEELSEALANAVSRLHEAPSARVASWGSTASE